jgi:hypothetical protein
MARDVFRWSGGQGLRVTDARIRDDGSIELSDVGSGGDSSLRVPTDKAQAISIAKALFEAHGIDYRPTAKATARRRVR